MDAKVEERCPGSGTTPFEMDTFAGGGSGCGGGGSNPDRSSCAPWTREGTYSSRAPKEREIAGDVNAHKRLLTPCWCTHMRLRRLAHAGRPSDRLRGARQRAAGACPYLRSPAGTPASPRWRLRLTTHCPALNSGSGSGRPRSHVVGIGHGCRLSSVAPVSGSGVSRAWV